MWFKLGNISHYHNCVLGLIICHLPHGPTAYFTISDLVMRHDIPNIGNMSEAYPHLIFHNFKSRLGERVSGYIFIILLKGSTRPIAITTVN